MQTRKPIVAGQFYSADKAELEKEVRKYMKIKPDKTIKAAIVPHAGYMFSGKCAASVYSILPEAETYILLGVNHNAIGKDIAISLEDFETPLGEAKTDTKFGEEIIRIIGKEDNDAHRYEHSIEVQLPFLQVSQQNFKIVPIILRNYDLGTCKKLANAIYEVSRKLKRKIIVLASSDFTHAGPSYGFSGDMKIDKEAIDKILAFDTEKFIKVAEKTTICGAGAIATTIEIAKLMNCQKAKLLDYYDSSKIMPGENKVGYAGIALFA